MDYNKSLKFLEEVQEMAERAAKLKDQAIKEAKKKMTKEEWEQVERMQEESPELKMVREMCEKLGIEWQ